MRVLVAFSIVNLVLPFCGGEQEGARGGEGDDAGVGPRGGPGGGGAEGHRELRRGLEARRQAGCCGERAPTPSAGARQQLVSRAARSGPHLAGQAADASAEVLAAQRLDVLDLEALHIQVV
jgi:hypothetical protein